MRQDNGEPTEEAPESGIAVFTPLKDGRPHWMWDKRVVRKRLKEVGIRKDLNKVRSLRIKETIRKMVGVVESEEFEIGGGFSYKVAYQYLFDLLEELIKRHPHNNPYLLQVASGN